MMGLGGTHKEPSFKNSREPLNHDRVHQNSHTSVHLANYTEKSLLVLQNYVFMEKKRRQSSHMFRGQGDAFMNEDTTGVNLDVPSELWEAAKISKQTEKAMTRKKCGSKPRSWLPNGGGMKPYNASEVQKAVRPEECIIDVKAVKPKVDTWFKLKPQKFQEVPKTSQSVGQPQKTNTIMKRAATTIVSHHVHPELEVSAREREQKVKNLTTFWNDHLQKHPLTVAQKSSTANTEKQRGADLIKSKSRTQVTGRPKSVGSDGVIQEHTLQPSKILSEKKKLSSVEDILVFAKLSGSRKSGGDGPTPRKHQGNIGKRGSENTVKLKNNSLSTKNSTRILQKTESPLKNIEILPTAPQGRGVSQMKKSCRHDHPKFVVRLHPRWILALRVLSLCFRPLVDMWKRKCFPLENAGLLKLAGVGSVPVEPSTCLASGEIMKEKFATSVKKCSERFGKLKRLARQGMSDTLRILTDKTGFRQMEETSTFAPYTIVRAEVPSFFRTNRQPLVTEPTSTGAIADMRHLKTTSLEILPQGIRIALYVEYQLVFTFILVQLILLAIVLFIKWLQEYTM